MVPTSKASVSAGRIAVASATASKRKRLYRTRAARPAATMKMGAAVCCAAQPELLEDEELEAPVTALEALELMVVEPAVLVKVDEPDVTVVKTAAVETADEVPFPEPAPPAAP